MATRHTPHRPPCLASTTNTLAHHSLTTQQLTNQPSSLYPITDVAFARESMRLVCTIFATSKLRVLDDLLTVTTFGFRGGGVGELSHGRSGSHHFETAGRDKQSQQQLVTPPVTSTCISITPSQLLPKPDSGCK